MVRIDITDSIPGSLATLASLEVGRNGELMLFLVQEPSDGDKGDVVLLTMDSLTKLQHGLIAALNPNVYPPAPEAEVVTD